MKNNFEIKDTFWSYYQKLANDVLLPYQYAVLNDSLEDEEIEKSHSIENFRIAAGEHDGEFYGQVFQDSDTAKWLEAVAYSLMIKPNKELEKQADDIIDLIGRAQEEDGYLNTYFTVKRPDGKWKNLQEGHELYCSGHMIEAGVAYYEATGKTKLLEIVKKNADLIYHTFGKDKQAGIPGHSEIELALVRLYRVTGEQKYLELATYFIDERGQNPGFFAEEKAKRDWVVWGMNAEDTDYAQNTKPVREEEHAVGHAVRAVYLYTAMAMAAGETGDQSLTEACEKMWNNIVNKRMYLTGGIGSTPCGEAFTLDYDLPNDTAYTETCASVGLVFFAKEMLGLKHDAKYADVMECALYNTVLAGIQRDGKRFFYTNPLEADPMYTQKLPELRHIYAERPKWHACACCPPNAARLITSLNRYAWHNGQNIIYSDLFIQGEYCFHDVKIAVDSEYPYGDTVKYQVSTSGAGCTLAVRLPYWSRRTEIQVNHKGYEPEVKNGYAFLKLSDGDEVMLTLDTSPRKVYANPDVSADTGKCAVIAGPLVYCFEDVDGNQNVNWISIDVESEPELFEMKNDILGDIRAVKVQGHRLKQSEGLYSFKAPESEKATLMAIPYYAWGNRGSNRMKVWLPER